MTQEELSTRLFITRQTLSNYENQKTHPDIDMLLKIAEELGTDLNTVIYGIPEREATHRERRRLVIGGIDLLLTLVCTAVVHHFDRADVTYNLTLKLLIHLVLFPLVWCLLGWTIVQGTMLVTHPKPWHRSWMNPAKSTVLLLLTAYAVWTEVVSSLPAGPFFYLSSPRSCWRAAFFLDIVDIRYYTASKKYRYSTKEMFPMPRAKFQTLTEQMFYILLCLKTECCGMDVMDRVPEMTSGRVQVGSGTLYNLLEQFLDADMIVETKAEGRRRSYILTEKGREALEKEYDRLNTQAADYRRAFLEEGSQ